MYMVEVVMCLPEGKANNMSLVPDRIAGIDLGANNFVTMVLSIVLIPFWTGTIYLSIKRNVKQITGLVVKGFTGVCIKAGMEYCSMPI